MQIFKYGEQPFYLTSCVGHELILTLVEDLETICCFLDFQETSDSPMKTQKQRTD